VKVKGEPGVQVWVRDISKPKRYEEVQRRLATAVEQAAEAIVITDTKGDIQYVNPAFEKITGYTREEVLDRNPGLLKSGEHDQKFYQNLWETIKRGDVWTGRFANRKKDGSLYHEEATISPVRDSRGTIVNFVAVKRDVTEHIQLSAQLVQAQKMEAVGTLAGGIAHDFNNLLQVTLGYSELLLAERQEDDPEYADLSRILQAAKNGAELVQRLLTFSRKVEPKPIPLDLNRRIVQVEKLLKRTIPKMIDIQMHLSDDLAEINADPIQMEQVLMNLAVNARDAMPDGGNLILETRNVALDDEYCKVHVGAGPGDYVLLTVSDTGHGMDKTTVEHIFEPFYTTKELGRGTGLGLAIVYGIVRQHEGFITCYSEVGTGTTFNVYFPAIERHLEPAVEMTGVMPAFGTETILLVDDEAFVRDLGERILSRAGYTVLTAANGIEALDLFTRKEKQIDLVILDLIMPEMGGEASLKELLKIDPGVKVLVASGYSADTSMRGPLALGARGFVSKPFRLKELLRQVRKVLDES
jgi:two-component system, cell cycle sensor histidine kinase and response regulator CckA